MRIEKIKVIGLFGNLDHEIPLHESGITLLHGPNGSGKTTVLSLLKAIFNFDVDTLVGMKFTSCQISMSDDVLLTVEHSDNNDIALRYSYHNNKQTIVYDVVPTDEQAVRYDTLRAIDYWPDLKHSSPKEKMPAELSAVLNSFNFEFIQSQRLFKITKHQDANDEVTEVIREYSAEIQKTIAESLKASALTSQANERTFPQRLLTFDSDQNLSESHIRQEYSRTQDNISKLMRIGLIESEETLRLPDKKLDETELKVISLNLHDVNAKLAVYDDLNIKVDTFLSIVSPKLRNKKFTIDSHQGFVFEVPDQSTSLDPGLLSSGEQHQIVLFYQLIFRAPKSSILLIDEPEISLHVDWQRRFLADITKVTNITDVVFIIATHSPQIIGSRRDLAVALDGGILYEHD